MTTAQKFHSLATGARTFVLAGSLALATIVPSVGIVFADGGVSTPSADQPALTQDQAFDVDPAGGLTNIEAVVVAPTTEAPLLAEPAADAEVVDTLPEGTNVLLRIDTTDSVYSDDGQTRFWPVDVGGTTGWVNGQSLMSPEDFAARSGTSADGSTTAPSATDRQPFDYTGELENATAQVDADGEGLTLRAEPAASSDAVASIQEGAIVDLRIADVDTVYDTEGTRWWPVSYEGHDGWVSGYYLIAPGSTPQSSDTATSPADTTRQKPLRMAISYTSPAIGPWSARRIVAAPISLHRQMLLPNPLPLFRTWHS